MKIILDHISGKPLELKGDEPAERFPALMEMQSAGECVFVAPVSYALTAEREFDHIRVNGVVGTKVKLRCSRCLDEYETALDSTFTIIYRRGGAHNELMEDETELTEDDLVSSVFYGDEIELDHELEEQVAMSVPFKPLCVESCKGLCPDCGADLNKVSCSCADKAFNFKFSALKDFKVNR